MAVQGRVGPCEVRFIGRAALIKNKRSTGRTKDLADVEQLTALRDERGVRLPLFTRRAGCKLI